MRFEYFDMLSGEPILFENVGRLKSPQLRNLCPNSGIGYSVYSFYLAVLSWDKEALLKYARLVKLRGADKLQREEVNFFDAIIALRQTRELCREVLSFFIVEQVEWDEKKRCFNVYANIDEQKVHVGQITRLNFEEVRKAILQLNFIGLDADEVPVKHSSEASKKLWERTQKYLEEQSKASPKGEKPEYHISNIISKLCAAHPSYNLLNIYDLTVFQLYDAFFQFGYMRSSNLSERIFSNHGGKKFNFEDWLKPILKNV